MSLHRLDVNKEGAMRKDKYEELIETLKNARDIAICKEWKDMLSKAIRCVQLVHDEGLCSELEIGKTQWSKMDESERNHVRSFNQGVRYVRQKIATDLQGKEKQV